MLKWFRECKTQKDAKSLYHKLCRQYHPDISGADTTSIMQEINAEFEAVFDRLPTSEHKQAESEARTASGNATTKQTAQRFMKIIERLIHCEGLKIEIVGSWIWLSGDTFKYLRCIKQMGFLYSAKHKKYYLSDGDTVTRRGSRYSFQQICDKYGVENIEAERTAKLT